MAQFVCCRLDSADEIYTLILQLQHSVWTNIQYFLKLYENAKKWCSCFIILKLVEHLHSISILVLLLIFLSNCNFWSKKQKKIQKCGPGDFFSEFFFSGKSFVKKKNRLDEISEDHRQILALFPHENIKKRWF